MVAWRMARVYYLPAHADMLVARIISWATMGDPVSRGPGLDQGDAVQFVTHMAYLRHACAVGSQTGKHALFFRDGALQGIRELPFITTSLNNLSAMPILGDERYHRPGFGSGQMGEQWPHDLMLACDTVLRKVAGAEQGPAVVPGWGGEYPGGASPIPGGIGVGGLAVLVAGAAVAVVGSFAAWRYFAPEVRMQAAAVASAARAYETRLRAMAQNGVELPPSPIELAQAQAVRDAAKESQSRGLLIGAGALGGLGIGTTLLGYIRGRAA